jgi:hypothetical protein
MSNVGAPAPRSQLTAVWTGTEMIVWGGEVWTSFGDGARYNPRTDRWTVLNANGAPRSRTAHTAVWTGTEMLVWGGRYLPDYTFLNSGGTYNPARDSWTPISSVNAPQPRASHAAAWSGSEMIIWGGYIDPSPAEVNTGARYNPVLQRWTRTTEDSAPQARFFGGPDAAIWTGQAMFIYGGWEYPYSLNSTYLYYPETLAGVLTELILLVEHSDLTRNTIRPLIVSLESALQSLEAGDFKAAAHKLEVFQQKIDARLHATNPALAETLISAAQELIDRLRGAGDP